MDQRYQLESKTTEASSILRLDARLSCEASCLSTQMYYILVMTTRGSASNECHSAGMNEGFEVRKQFVIWWEMEFVGLLMNVLSTMLAAFERLVHKSQSSKTVGDDTKTGVTVLGMEDMRCKAYLNQNSAWIASRTRERKSSTSRQPVPGVRLKNKGKGQANKSKSKGKDSQDKGKSKDKDTKNDSSKKSRRDDKKRCHYCQETGHVWSQCGSRLKDLADAEERSVIANTPIRTTLQQLC